jgi:hypothetical protein
MSGAVELTEVALRALAAWRALKWEFFVDSLNYWLLIGVKPGMQEETCLLREASR